MARSNNPPATSRAAKDGPIADGTIGAPAGGQVGGHAGTPAQGRELRARGRRTLRKLLDAGIEVFARRGYHAARVDDIVKVAKTSHGTFYLYFANKEDLFRALAVDVTHEMAAVAADLPPLEPGADGRASLRAWLEQFADLYEHYGPVIRAWTEAEIGDSDFGRLGNDVLTGFARALADRIRELDRADIDPDVAALALVAMIERFNYYVLARQVQVSRDAMLDTLTRVVHAGLVPAA
ncbi:MAG TPA: TetR/AcrR family transcriptional regulator [Acidimicrobiia bacterium]|nr:TetR/AcrR family transcriptional regulator [Acidimicrobiia bacterium]